MISPLFNRKFFLCGVPICMHMGQRQKLLCPHDYCHAGLDITLIPLLLVQWGRCCVMAGIWDWASSISNEKRTNITFCSHPNGRDIFSWLYLSMYSCWNVTQGWSFNVGYHQSHREIAQAPWHFPFWGYLRHLPIV